MLIEQGSQATEDCAALLEAAADVSGLSVDAAALSLYRRAIASPSVLSLAPRVAAEVHLSLLVGLAPISDASLWVQQLSGGVIQVAAVGEHAATRRFRNVAQRTITGAPAARDDDR